MTHNASRRDGFTLLEVMITVIVLTFGIIAVMWAFNTGFFASGVNESELIAINLTQEKMEEIRNSSYANVLPVTKAAVSGFPAFEREVVITTPQDNLKQVTVNTYFVKNAEMSVSLVTYVSNV